MTRLWDSPIGLLLVTGLLLGLTLPFGKVAVAAGVAPSVWAFVLSFGAGATLLALRLVRGQPLRRDAARLRYFAIAAAISYALPNLILLSAIPHLGAGYTGIMYTLSPVITLLFSIAFGVRRPTALGIAGVLVGFAGALTVAWTRGEAGRPADVLWVVLALCIPVLLAAGNVYRTAAWPAGADPLELASGCHLAAAALLAAFVVVSGDLATVGLLAGLPLVVVAQVAAAAFMFGVFFRLQAVGGPVYLSQIGYVGAAVGLASGTWFLGESYGPVTWLGAFVILVGIALTTKAQLAT